MNEDARDNGMTADAPPFGISASTANAPSIGAPAAAAGGPPAADPVSGVLPFPVFGSEFVKMTHCHSEADQVALWYIDIRGFRSINPKYGYFTGNTVLHTVADLIKEKLTGDMPITRLGGDRFVLVSAGKDLEQATDAFKEIVKCVNAKVKEFGVANRISLVGGVYYLRDDDFERHDYRRALDYASIAHRKAQLDPHSSLVPFTDEDLERDMRRIVIEQSIDQALTEGQIEVWFQPQIDYIFGEVVGAEALARWNHPDLGWISPTEFIPVLENCGRIHDLDLFVWEEACRSAGRWHGMADGRPVPISVNVSRAEMLEEGLMEHFKKLQEKYDLPDGSLHLEVTESAFVEEADSLYKIISAMRANDMVVEMDDFGSGLSSLNMLKDVPVDVVKLDMGFVRAGMNEDRGGVVLSSIIRMLQGLDTPIIAEGVETLEQAEMLKNMGCHLMQGFHFSRPMPLKDFENYVLSTSTESNASRRIRKESHLEDIMSFDRDSSYLFNEALGGMMFFFTHDGSSESILVNDRFYDDCGLDRLEFGTGKVNPIDEIEESSRETMWRAAAEAHENGSALCVAQVRRSGRWFEGVIRYIGGSTRGDIFSLTIVRSGDRVKHNQTAMQIAQDFLWNLDMLNKISPTGFVKCDLTSKLLMDYISPTLVEASGLTEDSFLRRFRNSLRDIIAPIDRGRFADALIESIKMKKVIDTDVELSRAFGSFTHANVMGRVEMTSDDDGWLYLAVMLKNAGDEEIPSKSDSPYDRVIPFDYFMDGDLLVIHAPMQDGSTQDIIIEKWLDKLDSLPDNIAPASAAKVLATISDLKRYPMAGFTDLKCNLRGGVELRWYHINYTCELDAEGNLAVLHGEANDANDEMGSARWWRRQAEIDPLTGLLNRNTVEQDVNLALRTTGGGAMLMIDLDDFKRVNDQLGHPVGDELLRKVADTLASRFRENDVLGRYGGDEFVAFMPFPPEVADAESIVEHRARDVVESISNIAIPDGTHAGCSVGTAITFSRDKSFYDLLQVADTAMYASKTSGKGKFTVQRM